jgi:DUF1680 family protein
MNLVLTRRKFVRNVSALGVASLVSVAPRSGIGQPERNGVPSSPPDTETINSTELHKLEAVPIDHVVIDDDFWAPKRKAWREVTLRDCFKKFESDRGGAINNFDKVRAGQTGGHAGPPWTDGLIYEMIRGASDFLSSHPDAELEKLVDGYISRITAAAAVNPHGYINTYTQLMEPGHEWGLNGGLQLWQHEIYNLGALIDAGVHYYRATGKTTLLASGVKIANYMCEYMGPPPKHNLVPCHPLPEEALVRLYELFVEQPSLKAKLSLPVQEAQYLQLAEFWIEDRGNNIGKPDWEKDHQAAEQFVRKQEYGTGRPSWGPYTQDDVSVFEQQDIHGHAVRATLLCTGIAAAAKVNDEERYRQTAIRLWENMVYRRMHITGGVGAFANEEKFGPDYILPNDAYLETCAAVGAGFFHHNMNMAFGHSRYVDELERTLYNGTLAGVSLHGDSYFYENPLVAGKDRTRWSWHECPCCPPMFLKMMGAMPGYIYATDADSVYVNLFVAGKASIRRSATEISISQTTRYPWSGSVKIALEPSVPTNFALMVRIPGWCSGETATVNGQRVDTSQRTRGYLRILRTWRQGGVVEVEMPMPVRQMRSNPLVQADAGRIAIMRGPLVYCLESTDNRDSIRLLRVPAGARFSEESRDDLLGGVIKISAAGIANSEPAGNRLYFPLNSGPADQSATITAIPYYANANRGAVEMAVWIPVES